MYPGSAGDSLLSAESLGLSVRRRTPPLSDSSLHQPLGPQPAQIASDGLARIVTGYITGMTDSYIEQRWERCGV